MIPQISPKVKKIAAAVLAFALLFVIAGIKVDNWFRAKFHKNQVPVVSVIKSVPTLKPDEREQVLVNNLTHQVTIVTDKGVTQVSGVRRTLISVKKDGNVAVTIKDKGLTLEPGLSVSVTDHGPRAGFDFGVAYYKRLDLIVGVGFNNKLADTRGYLAVGYTPKTAWLSNVDFFAGITTEKTPIVGVRVRL